MVAIPLPVTSVPGYRTQESAGRLINTFAEPIGEGSKDAPPPSKRVRVPGMTEFATSSQTGFRGMALLAGSSPLYVAFDGQLYKGNSAGGALTVHGALSGTLPVYFARNNAVVPDKVVVTENDAFIITDPNTITAYPDIDLPQPNGVCAIDGYFVFTIGDGRIFASDLNSTAVNTLSLGTAETKADPPVRPVPFSGRLLIFGQQSLEVWTDVGSTPFPFQRATSVPFGLIGADAVAGWEDGWGAGLLWVADDHTVRQLDGYTPVRVSVPDLERLIQRDTNKARMLASVHVVDGHPMWTITGETFSWSYDLSTRKWHERASYLTNRWRGLQSVNAFGKWLVGDRGTPGAEFEDDGNIYEIDPTNHFEAGDLLPMRIESGPVMQFPERVRVAKADFHVEVGVGIVQGDREITIFGAVAGTAPLIRLTVTSTSLMQEGDMVRVADVLGTTEANGVWTITIVDSTHIELTGSAFANTYTSGGTVTLLTVRDPIQTDPTIIISWSDNGGINWSVPLYRKLGPQSVYKNVSVTRVGMSTRIGRRWRLDISDPVYVALFGGEQSAELRKG